MSPFKALYGREPLALTRGSETATSVPAVQDHLENRTMILNQLKEHLAKAQQRMKDQADKGRKDVNLKLGTLVLVKLQPYRQTLQLLERTRN